MNKTKRTTLRRAAIALLGLSVMALPARAQDSETLTLKQAIELGLKNSRDLALARLQYTVARNAAGVDRAEFHPNIYTGAGAVYSNGFPETPGGAAPSIFKLSYTQTVFNPLLRGRMRADEDRARNQELEVERTRDTVIVRTATSYLELAKVRHALELLRNERTSAQRILDYVRERSAAGLELPIEVTRAELTSAKIEHQVVKLEGRDDVLTEQLRDQLGLPADKAIVVAPEDLPASAEQQTAELENLALDNSIDVKEAENERSARQHLQKGAHGAYWPTVDLIGEYDVLSKINNYNQFFKSFQRNNVNFGVQITIPLLAAKTHAASALAKSELAVSELALGTKREKVRLDVRQRARTAREMDAAREEARLDLKLAQESLAVAQSKFDQGQSSLRELEQARLDESEKWVGFLDADFARQQGQLALLQSTGQLAKVFQ